MIRLEKSYMLKEKFFIKIYLELVQQLVVYG